MNSEDRKVFFIVNKYSGTGFKPEMDRFFHETCRMRGWELALEYTQGPGHATTLAAEALRAGFGKIVAVGGDGTVNEVAQSLVHTPAAMGIVPKGSGNGLARHLGIPLNPVHALDCLFTSNPVSIDTFLLNGRLSLNVSGIGFDGYIAELFGLEKERGFQGYTKLVVNEFLSFREFDAEVCFDEQSLSRNIFVVALANSSQYGNNARIAPTASVRDGFLNISLLKKVPAYRLDFIYSFFSGTIDQSPYCETLQVRDASIKLKAPMSFHIDGEPAGKAASFSVKVMPSSLNILAPCDSTKF